jgi:hypothetical protein
MKLIVHEILGSVSQEIITPNEVVQLEAVRPHLYKHNSPSGTVKVQVTDLNDELIAESDELTITDISAEDFFHGYITFYINAQLRPDTVYKFKTVCGGGYTFSDSAYLGVVNAFNGEKYESDYSPSEDFNAALDLELWKRD